MVVLSGGDLCEDYIYYGYTEDDIYYGRYIIDNEDIEEPEIDEETELEEEHSSISKWEYRLMMLV
jgi:hypothetical protein